MNRFPAHFSLICVLFAVSAACSASDPGAAFQATGGNASHAGSSGSSSQAASSAGGSSSSAGGTGGNAASGGGSSGATQAGAGAGGSVGTAGASSAAGGGAGSSGASGSGGAAPACTPGSGTALVGDQSLLDQKTCLIWTKARSTSTLTNKQAYKYCNDLTQDGISDWRVPSPEELVTWPGLVTDSTAYITGPIYIPNDAASVMDGCTGDSHSCNIAKYNDTSVTCGWQGVGFAGWVACVSGTATQGTTNAAYSAASCTPCNSELTTFKVTDCSAYAN